MLSHLFGPAEEWPSADLIAFSEEFDAPLALAGYRSGVFPMPLHDSGFDGYMGWWSPVHRGVLPLDQLRISRSLRQSAKRYHTSIDTAFDQVIARCADPTREGGWIDADVQRVYTELFEAGVAHSVETWDQQGRLVGGLYGVALGGLFAGESMFHDPQLGRDASKTALLRLVSLLAHDGLPRLLDVQWRTDHLASLGVIEISREEYLRRLDAALELPPSTGPPSAGAGPPERIPMPELPEVEALRRFLEPRLVGRTIARVHLVAFSVLRTVRPPLEALPGLEIESVQRFGKYLVIEAQGVYLAFHLARAGWLVWRDAVPAATPRPGKGPLAFRLVLDDDSGFDLTEAGTQRKLAIHVATDPKDIERIATLGPDPLSADFTADTLGKILDAAGRSQLKGVLRDQRIIAGIGNAYSDEILHAAKMSPFKPASSLNEAERTALFDAIETSLRTAIARADGLAAKDLKDDKRSNMAVHGKTGQPCPVCGTPIAEVSFADSSLQYCPGCQTGGKPLADRRMSRLLK